MGDFNKQTKINKQVAIDGSSGSPVIFANVTDAKNFYYTANELAVFDTWCDNQQWAVVNDGSGNATWLKVTIDFDADGKSVSWHSALDDLSGELTAHHQAKIAGAGDGSTVTFNITVEESSDHLY